MYDVSFNARSAHLMNTLQTIDIVLPTYRSASYILETLASVKRACETSGNVARVYVADDASPDGTASVVHQTWTGATRLEILSREKNVGECINVNEAFQKMRSDGVQWALLLHADDQMHPLWPAIAARAITEAPAECGLICCLNTFANSEVGLALSETIALDNAAPHRWFPGNRNSINCLGRDWFWNVTGTLIKVSAYNDVGGFHPELKYAGDNDLILRFFLGGHGAWVIDHAYVFKRGHQGSVTSGQMVSGAYAIGWSHLMHRYLWLDSRWGRSRSFAQQIYRAVRGALSAMRRGDIRFVFGQARAVWIFLRSWVALICGLPWLNPAPVRLALSRRFPYQDKQQTL